MYSGHCSKDSVISGFHLAPQRTWLKLCWAFIRIPATQIPEESKENEAPCYLVFIEAPINLLTVEMNLCRPPRRLRVSALFSYLTSPFSRLPSVYYFAFFSSTTSGALSWSLSQVPSQYNLFSFSLTLFHDLQTHLDQTF